jgi:hypothetical protein
MDADTTDRVEALPEGMSQLILTFDRGKFLLTIGGSMFNLDEGICICEMAARTLKGKLAAAEQPKIFGAGGRGPFAFPRQRSS